jgi:putative nucleotidyltransferase with HDIG domain
MRVLFVDDDATGLATLRHSLTSRTPGWDIHVASTPGMAVLMSQRAGFDVALININTPAYEGIEASTYFARNFPETVRLAFIDDPMSYRAIHTEALAYQAVFATSPVEEIIQTIERATELHRRLGDPMLSHLISGVNGLPSPPKIIIELNEALAQPNISVNEVTEIVSNDVAIPARILHVVNTAYFALARTMTNIREAVAYLGFDAVRNLALAVEMFRELTDPKSAGSVRQVEILQTHSAAVAQMTRQFVTHQQDAQDAFVGGLLHDVGHLIMATYFPTQYAEINRRVTARQGFILDVEREVIGLTHADLGAFLLRQWGLPFRLIDVVAFHHEAPLFVTTGMDAVHGVYIGEHLLAERDSQENAYWEFSGIDKLRDEYLDALGVFDRITSWRTLHVGFGANIR